MHRLEALRRWAADLWADIDVLILPTTGTTFTIAEIEAEPLARNRMLGRYTHFANLLDTAALTVPAGLTADGRPASLSSSVPPTATPSSPTSPPQRSVNRPRPERSTPGASSRSSAVT